MQKVVGSSPIIRSLESPGKRGFSVFEHEVESRSEHRRFGLVVADVAAVVAAARERGAGIRGDNLGDPWGNRFDAVAYSTLRFPKAEPVPRAQPRI
jgi:hypothetical protein